MHPKRKRKLLAVLLLLLGCFVAVALVLKAFQKNLMYFHSPSEVRAGTAPEGRNIRIGGLVVAGSVSRDPDSLLVRFTLTDTAAQVTVRYDGILPDLFREGQGIVANGRLDRHGVFQASEVLAKHDEYYMPPEVAEALQKAEGVNKEHKAGGADKPHKAGDMNKPYKAGGANKPYKAGADEPAMNAPADPYRYRAP